MKIPKGATMHRIVWAGGAADEIRLLHAISHEALVAGMYGEQPPTPNPPSVLSDDLPDGEYWLIDGKWVPA